MARDWTRRQLLGQAGLAAGLAGLGLAACGDPAGQLGLAAPRADSGADGLEHFISRPDLTPPVTTVTRHGLGSDARLTFLNAPWSGPGRGGSVIRDAAGGLIWFGPNTRSRHRMDVGTQLYRGKPVLTWWQGVVTAEGYGLGDCVIADSAYRVTHTIRAHRGLQADLHEFRLTDQGTALITAYRTRPADLSPIGGPAAGWVLSGVVQEIDVATGDLVFEWDSLDHVPVTESAKAYAGETRASPFNYFQINSITVAPDGTLLISSRNTWTVYKVARPSGRIIWRLGGKKSDFSRGRGTRFYWQHHARWHGSRTLTLFDNGASPGEESRSRALILDLDTARMRVTLRRAFAHPGRVLLSGAMGSAQLLPDGKMFVGWGSLPYFSEFAADGGLLADGQITDACQSYRAFSHGWTGRPAEPPVVAARHPQGGGSRLYASWNGATEVASWTVLAGRSASSLAAAGTFRRTGFETAMTVRHRGSHVAVEARNAAGHVLARSAPITV
jgi:Arylsulfotransferase (ASST)